MKTLMERKSDITLLIIRLSLGIVIFAHGAQKLFGWFGGFGYEDTMRYFTQTAGLPYLIGMLVILGESLGALALILGLLGRFMSGSIFVIMFGAMYLDHASNGFFMNWYGTRAGGEGIEFDLLVFGLSLAVIINGSGAYSVDHYLFNKRKKETANNPSFI